MLKRQDVSKYLREDVRRSCIKFGAALVIGLLFVGVAFGTSAPKVAQAACAGNAYNVVSGDTLSGIAVANGTNWQALATANHLANPDYLRIGQTVCIPGAKQALAKAAPTKAAPAKAPTSINAMIDQVFGRYAAQAKRVAMCESSMNPNATNRISIGGSHAAGLFQVLYPSTWRTTSQANQSPYNAYANIKAAHEIFARDGNSWREWVCKP